MRTGVAKQWMAQMSEAAAAIQLRRSNQDAWLAVWGTDVSGTGKFRPSKENYCLQASTIRLRPRRDNLHRRSRLPPHSLAPALMHSAPKPCVPRLTLITTSSTRSEEGNHL